MADFHAPRDERGSNRLPLSGDIYVKRAMIKASSKVFLLADSTKIGRASFSSLGPVGLVHRLTTDDGIRDEDRRHFEAAGVEVVVAQ